MNVPRGNKPMSRWKTSVVLALMVVLSAPATAAAGIDLDDPNLFGPGEGWDRPVTLQRGQSGPWVVRLQEQLADAGLRPGAPDGVFGKATLGAVYAFQKVNDLERDGIVHADDWDALAEYEPVSLPVSEETPDRVEIDLDRQILYLVVDNEVETIVPISSGNGELYRGRGGSLVRARTPEGSYRFTRHIDGWRVSYLGALYRPFYFRGGYAIHGSSSVPPFPASHGCVRVENHDMDYLVTQFEVGMPILVYGDRVERTELFET
jgi:peptidoglycan hydrolase-like protein with peptidoglycan-binding domain